MSMPVLVFAMLLLCGLPALLQEAQQPSAPPTSSSAPTAASQTPAAEAPIPAATAAQTNPVHATPQSLARAKVIYGYDCALCHGKDGSGVSDMDPNTKLRDYRNPTSLKDLTDGQIFYIIQNGRGSMPGEGPRAKPDEVWNLVIYLRSMSKGQAEPKVQVAQ